MITNLQMNLRFKLYQGAGARQPWRRDLEDLRVYNQQYQDDEASPAVSDDVAVNVDPFLYDYTPKKSNGK